MQDSGDCATLLGEAYTPPRTGVTNLDSVDNQVTATAVNVRLSWTGFEDVPIQAADQLLVQFVQDYFILSLGQTAHPPIVGDDDPRMKQLIHDPVVAVRPVARAAVSFQTMERFVAVMSEVLQAARKGAEHV